MGIYKYIRNNWNNPSAEVKQLWKSRIIQWRKEPVTLRIEHPTRLDRARAIGYKAKDGLFFVRQRVSSGPHMRPDWAGGRHTSNSFIVKPLEKNYRQIAEERANKSFVNCEVINSYFVAKDGRQYWFEVLLADRSNPAVLKDPQLSWLGRPANRTRAFRGLTRAARKARGLMHKGKGTENMRPSRNAHRV